jgi:peroxiredoxin
LHRSAVCAGIGLLSLWLWLGGVSCARSEAVDFTLPDLDGQPRSLSEFRGQWVVVNYWATWCPPCLEEMSELEIFHSRHRDGTAAVLAVNMEDIAVERLREFAETQFLSFPILRDRPRPRTELGPVPGLPTTYLVAPDGAPVARQLGPVTAERLERFIGEHADAYPTTGDRR